MKVLSALFLGFLTACAPAPSWIHESSSPPSCVPDRMVAWADYVKRRDRQKNASAETAMQFGIVTGTSPPRLQVRFDPHRSWVLADLADPRDTNQWRRSEWLLAHERLHYVISCLLVRQANLVLSTRGGNIQEMLHLVKATAQHINARYDADTRHGLDLEAQQAWIKEVMAQFSEVSESRAD